MAISKVDLWNMALSLAQETGTIVDPDENKKSANLCRLWYDRARRQVLKANYWPCSTTYTRLALLEARGTVDLWAEGNSAPGRAFLFSEPVGLLAPQYLDTYAPFERLHMSGHRTIATDAQYPILRYTFDQEDETAWDEGLVMAVTTYHAALMTRNINGKLGLSDRLRREAADALVLAGTDIANENDRLFDAIPENLHARGYTGTASSPRYFFPVADLNGVSA